MCGSGDLDPTEKYVRAYMCGRVVGYHHRPDILREGQDMDLYSACYIFNLWQSHLCLLQQRLLGPNH